MKLYIGLLAMFAAVTVTAQEEKKKETKKDTIIKTEVINVVTSYVPKITDAFKIKKKPEIKHTKQTERKALDYKIFSVPVASTFIPKSGTMKKVDLGKKEFIYPNYVSFGFGNNVAPELDVYIRQSEYYNSELGARLKFFLSADPVEAPVSSTYYNADLDVFYKQVDRYFTWKAGINIKRDKYTWYGLPTNINFLPTTIDAIEEAQVYTKYGVYGKVLYDEVYLGRNVSIVDTNARIGLMTDGFDSSEFEADLDSKFKFDLSGLHRQLYDLYITTTINFFGGNFATGYNDNNEIKNGYFTVGLHPEYKFFLRKLGVRLGGKMYFAMDSQNNENQFYIYPNIEFDYPIAKDLANVFIGAKGDLKNNTFASLSEENPFISPTQRLLQTSTKYDVYGGVRGHLGANFSYQLKGSYADIENNPFFMLNQSKSNGTLGTVTGFDLFGYDFGNSFNVTYDNMKRVSITPQVTYEGVKNLSVSLNATINSFTLDTQQEAWNTPQLSGELSGAYKKNKWYAGANVYFVGERKGILYAGNDTAIAPSIVDLKSYIDVNLNGGYNFSDSFSVYLKLNNVLNSDYQRFTNFQVQGFQAMAGVTWKFDSIL